MASLGMRTAFCSAWYKCLWSPFIHSFRKYFLRAHSGMHYFQSGDNNNNIYCIELYRLNKLICVKGLVQSLVYRAWSIWAWLWSSFYFIDKEESMAQADPCFWKLISVTERILREQNLEAGRQVSFVQPLMVSFTCLTWDSLRQFSQCGSRLASPRNSLEMHILGPYSRAT